MARAGTGFFQAAGGTAHGAPDTDHGLMKIGAIALEGEIAFIKFGALHIGESSRLNREHSAGPARAKRNCVWVFNTLAKSN